jgi:hypothetical protein
MVVFVFRFLFRVLAPDCRARGGKMFGKPRESNLEGKKFVSVQERFEA